jgi:hypothetical protein
MNTQKTLIRQIILNGGTIVVVALMLLAQRAWAGPAAQGATPGVMNYQGYLTLIPKVLVAGGRGSSGILNSAEVYGPATGTWTASGNLNTARLWHTATLLPDGKVLVAGGYAGSGVYLNSAEVYDPATGAWTASGNLNTARHSHTATLLPDRPINGNRDMTFRLYAQPSGGTALWDEAHTGANAVPVTNGLFNVLLGSLKPIESTVWDSPDLYLEVQVGNERMTPREQVGRVPYAMAASHALAADSAKQLDAPSGDPAPAVYVDNDGNVGIGTTSPGAGLEINRGDTNDLALLLESSGLGRGSGIQFKNTAATEGIWGIYADQNGALRFVDEDQNLDRLMIDPVGNIRWTGHLASLTVSGPWGVTLTAEERMGGKPLAMIRDTPYSVCFLTYTSFEDIDGEGEKADCSVTRRNGWWWVEAHLDNLDDATVECEAMCLQG